MAENISLEFDRDLLARIAEKREALFFGVMRATQIAQKIYLGEVRRRLQRSRIVNLLRSWRDFPIEVREDRIVAEVGSDHKLARLREEGHPGITPGKSAAKGGPRAGQPTRALAIPLGAARTKQMQVARGGTQSFGRLRFRPIKRGRTTRGIRGSDKVGLLIDDSDRAVFLLARRVKTRAFRDAAQTIATKRRDVIDLYLEEIERGLAD